MTTLYSCRDTKIKEIQIKSFDMEKELQTFFENNMFDLIGYKFIATEFSIDKYRFDSVAFDEETNSFVIVEYKRGINESLVDQGFAYLKTLLDRKADFILAYNEKMHVSKTKKDFDWSQTRIAFVSPHFTKFQKDAATFGGSRFELYEVTRYAEKLYSIDKIGLDTSVPKFFQFGHDKKANPLVKRVEKEIPNYDLNYHFKKSNCTNSVKEIYSELKNRITEKYPGIEENITKTYISYKLGGKFNLVNLFFHKSMIEVVLNARQGTIIDPYKLTYDITGRKWSAQYALKVTEKTDLDEVMHLINLTFKASKYGNGK